MTGVIGLDLDGTLVDCRARQVALAAALLPGLDEDGFWAAKRAGATTRQAFERLGATPDAAAAAAARWIAEIEDDCWLVYDRLLPRTEAALQRLRAAGHALIIVTARRDAEAVEAQLDRLGLTERVDGMHVVDPCEPALEKAAVLREQAASAFVGDTESDARAAADAGVPFLAVGCGQRSAARLAQAGIAPVHADLDAAALRLL